MTYTLVFKPEVEEDAISGYLWYEKKAAGLGEEFLKQFLNIQAIYLENLLFIEKLTENSDADYLKNSPSQSILKLKATL